ncbi:endospore germination permease [Haloimpatiens sp. FM7315]|uniref:GerAB/ArcD/ProY family transporter n=1 Tax=Haloimpatiens sp. FM7315 TaxID=3298609 RepID=UPI00370A0906
MSNEKILYKQGRMLIFIYLISAYLMFGPAVEARQDGWISVILGALLSLPLFIMYGKMLSLYPEDNLFQMLHKVFGKVFGKFLSFIYVFHSIVLSSLIIYSITTFINKVGLFNTPQIMICVILGALCIWIIKEGLVVFCDWSQFFIRIIIASVLIFWILLIPVMKFDNLRPCFYYGFKPIYKGAISVLSFPFSEAFLFFSILNSVDDKKNLKKIFIKPLVFSCVFITFATAINIMILGVDNYTIAYYPAYESTKRLELGGIIQRLEIISSIVFIITQFIELSICLICACKGIKEIFNIKDYKIVIFPTTLFCINISLMSFESIMEFTEFNENIWPNYSIFMQVVIPIIIFIFMIVKKNHFSRLN